MLSEFNQHYTEPAMWLAFADVNNSGHAMSLSSFDLKLSVKIASKQRDLK
jgi:hypothetical protein